jgi:hypothetical protein
MHDDIPACVVDLLTGTQEQVLAARAHVGAGQSQVGDRPLPEVEDGAGDLSGRDVDDQGAGPRQVREAEEVRRGRVGREQAELVSVAHVEDQVAVLGAEDLLVLFLPLSEAD